MVELYELLFTREHFPIVLNEATAVVKEKNHHQPQQFNTIVYLFLF